MSNKIPLSDNPRSTPGSSAGSSVTHALAPLRFRCPSCQKPVRASPVLAGRAGRCPACKGSLTIPTTLRVELPKGVELTLRDAVKPSSRSSPPAMSGAAMSGSAMSGAAMSGSAMSGAATSSAATSSAATSSAAMSGAATTRANDSAPAASAAAGDDNPGDSSKVVVGKTAFPTSTNPSTSVLAPTACLGRLLGDDYLLQEHIANGSYGAVFRARQISLDRLVAVKVISGSAINTRRLERLRREAQAMARLSHPHVLPVFGFGTDDDLHWLAMEYAEGGDVGHRVSAGRVEWPLAAEWLAQTLQGLAAAHEAGIIHRDIKPANLLLTSTGAIRLADFGLMKPYGPARLAEIDERRVGTPAYVAPEQAISDRVDARADIYSTGASFFHILAGRLVFAGNSPRETALKHLEEAPPDLARVAPHVPLPLCRIVMRMLEKSPSLRYQTAQAALADVLSYRGFVGVE